MTKANPTSDPCIPTELLRALGFPKPPEKIWQEPFDHVRGHCERIVTPSAPINLFDFCDYFLDYQYMEVQKNLLQYALPKALEGWARQELNCPDANKFKGDWHFEGMWDALAHRPLHPDFLNVEQYQAVIDFYVHVLLVLMQKETSLSFKGGSVSAYDWVHLHATLIWLFPSAEKIWSNWWKFETPAMAICAIQWLSSFLYEDDDNPYFAPWTNTEGGGAPCVFELSIFPQAPAVPENVRFLRQTLTADWASDVLRRASGVLVQHKRAEAVQQTLSEFPSRSSLFEKRVGKYLKVLNKKDPSTIVGWDSI